MNPKRERIIPHKRGLLAASSSSSSGQATPKVYKTINPSTVPAVVQLQKPVFSSLQVTTKGEDEKSGSRRYTTGLDDEEIVNQKVVRIEFDSSLAPQPFLEPELFQRIMESRRQKEQQKDRDEKDGDGEDAVDGEKDVPAASTTEREVRRRAAQVDYGSMAIQDRMNLRRRR